MKKTMLIAGLFCSFITLDAFSLSKSLSTEQLGDVQYFNRQADQAEKKGIKIEKLKYLLEQYVRQRDLDCQFAFGHQRFCNCLNKNLPISVTFYQYIEIITSDKTKLMSQLNMKDKKRIEMVFSARDLCVSELDQIH